MFRSMTNKEKLKNHQTVNIVNIDLKQVSEVKEKIVDIEKVSTIFKYFSVPNFLKFEIILIHDGDNQKRMYVLTKKDPLGFRLVEIEREVVTPLIDNELNLIDWHFDLDSHKLTLLYLNN
jgi:hypothetical protein